MSNFKVALIRPPMLLPASSNNTTQGVPPLSLAYLAGTLRNSGFEVSLIDSFGEAPFQFTEFLNGKLFINGLTADEIINKIPVDARVIGVSCMFSNEWVYYRKVISRIREAFPDAIIVVGGEHITADPDYSLNSCQAIDFCVLGEGESTLLELVQALQSNSNPCEIDGIVYRNASTGLIQKTPPRARIQKIDEIPWPSWDGIPLHNYLDNEFGNEVVTKRSMPMLASRGCPYECTFCSNPQMWGTQWKARDTKDLITEIRFYIDKYQINHVEFYDLT